MITFLKQIFTWWHRQTVGTFIYSLFSGKLMGKDQFGNKYYQNKDQVFISLLVPFFYAKSNLKVLKLHFKYFFLKRYNGMVFLLLFPSNQYNSDLLQNN